MYQSNYSIHLITHNAVIIVRQTTNEPWGRPSWKVTALRNELAPSMKNTHMAYPLSSGSLKLSVA